jgi:hypothetical protein
MAFTVTNDQARQEQVWEGAELCGRMGDEVGQAAW